MSDTTRAVMSVKEFCSAYGVSRAFFYELIKKRQGPRTMKLGRRTLISTEAAETWRKKLEITAT
jgi:excisionase family DNA binding protein